MPASLAPNDDRRPITPVRGIRGGDLRLPASPSSAASVGLSNRDDEPTSPTRLRLPTARPTGNLIRTASAQPFDKEEQHVYLELENGEVFEGISFGAQKSAAGELVFQTGMVGYPESVTDPSYRGQILVITFPLVGNYGVPSRIEMDRLLKDLPKHFESSEIHIAGLVTASYSGEDFSHHLATSSLGTWLKENGVPAMYGVDTRALTKRIRERGSMPARMLHEKTATKSRTSLNGSATTNGFHDGSNWREETDFIEWVDANTINFVKDGETSLRGSCWLIWS